jgi:hypothetical protein
VLAEKAGMTGGRHTEADNHKGLVHDYICKAAVQLCVFRKIAAVIVPVLQKPLTGECQGSEKLM